MAKRFTCTEKWNKKFLRSLPAAYKLLWFYILDECNSAGIWDVDMDVAQVKIGEKMSEQEAIKMLSGKVLPIDNGSKWFIPAFIDFQYGELSDTNRAHIKAIQTLKRFNLINDNLKIKPLASPLQAPAQGAMVEVEDMVEDKVEVIEPSEDFLKFCDWLSVNAGSVQKMKEPITEVEYVRLASEYDKKTIVDVLLSMHNYKDLNKKNTSANLTFRNWATRRGIEPVGTTTTTKKQMVL